MMTNFLLPSTIIFAAALAITESMNSHKFGEQMISHSFKYSALQVIGFLVMALGLFSLKQVVPAIVGVALIAVPVTDLVRKPFGKYRKRIHVISAGVAFVGAFVMAALYSHTMLQRLALVAYPASVAVVWYVWRNAVIAEKIAAYACIVWFLLYGADL